MSAALTKAFLATTRPLLGLDDHPLSRVLEGAIATKLGRQMPEALRSALDTTFSALGAQGAQAASDHARHLQQLATTRYKLPLTGSRWSATATSPLFRLATRVAARAGITFDILVLRSGDSIAPHGHVGTVSGMLVLRGEIGLRTYDVLSTSEEGATLRRGLDGRCTPGMVSTSSDRHHNLHWFHGIAPESHIFRCSVTNIGGSGHDEAAARIAARQYCIPGAVGPDGTVFGRWATREEAEAAPFFPAAA